jgi:hypothetical protein
LLQILGEQFNKKFYQVVSSSKDEIMLCAPFVKLSIINEVLKQKKPSTGLTLVTYYNLNYFWNQSSDLSAIENVINNKGKVFNCAKLHSKIYIFDRKQIIITSANLTYSAFNFNVECGIITDDENAINTTSNILKSFCTYENEITNSYVDLSKSILLNLPAPNKTTETSDFNEILYGKEDEIANTLNGWTKLVFSVVNSLNKQKFQLSEITVYHDFFKQKYPKNNNIEAKIRQQLQALRNIGLLKFIGHGVYEKLWSK